jgi:catechol 2,3-dioxygenase-like lactoylglutathione lyase family enzyme
MPRRYLSIDILASEDMINHAGIPVRDINRSRAFYEASLKPLGIAVTMTATPDQTESRGTAIGFGTKEVPGFFWIGDNEQPGEGVHVAFDAKSHEQVREFYAAALAAGGRDNGPPGPRPHYGPNYYAAFVYDPDGANIEAVCLKEA